MPNFHCNKCKKDFYIPSYITSFTKSGIAIYKTLRRNLLSCDYCSSLNIEIIQEIINYTEAAKDGGFFIGKFASSSMSEKKEFLKKRANTHSQKPSSIEEHKHRDKTQTLKSLRNIGK